MTVIYFFAHVKSGEDKQLPGVNFPSHGDLEMQVPSVMVSRMCEAEQGRVTRAHTSS